MILLMGLFGAVMGGIVGLWWGRSTCRLAIDPHAEAEYLRSVVRQIEIDASCFATVHRDLFTDYARWMRQTADRLDGKPHTIGRIAP